jgi:ATP-dependent Clp protease ATP-binding subunit ClpC
LIPIERFSKPAARALEQALQGAQELGHGYLGTEHLLLGLARESEGVAARLLTVTGLPPEKIIAAIRRRIGEGSPTRLSINDMTPRLEELLAEGGRLAGRFGFSVVGTDHLLAALCAEPRAMGHRLLLELGAEPKKLSKQLTERMDRPDLPLQTEKNKPRGGKQTAKFSINLTKQSALEQTDPLIGRERELERLMSVLLRKNKNNPCLVGPPGVGKTVLVEGLARNILLGKVPAPLQDLQILQLDLTAMIAGTKYRGEFEERLRALLEEAEKDPKTVLFIDELHLLMGAGAAEGAIDAANILKPALARGKIKVIGATTWEEYRKHIEKDGALERRFAPIYIEEPSPARALEILEGLRPALEAHHQLRLPQETLQAAIDLSVKYIGDRYLPDKAIDLLDEAGGRACIRAFSQGAEEQQGSIRRKQAELEQFLRARQFARALETKEQLDQLRILQPKAADFPALLPRHLAELIAEKTGIPLREEDPCGDALLFELPQKLQAQLIGQPQAVAALTDALIRSRAGLADPNRPACALLFCGPTGVGKTRLARLLAKELLGAEDALIKYDMAEFMEPHSVAKLIGAPPGYIGFDQGGGLVSRLRERPYAILLFDEIEKAHPDVLNIMLSILDEGRLTDNCGKTADFRNATILFTSNLGGEAFTAEPLGFGDRQSDGNKTARAAVCKALRPEFINRLDEIIPFAPLSEQSLLQIVRLQLDDMETRLAKQGITARFGAGVAEEVLRRGQDRRYGARAVRRCIEQEIGVTLAKRILAGDLPAGELTVSMLFGPSLTLAVK